MNFIDLMTFMRPKPINKNKIKPKKIKSNKIFISIGKKCGIRHNIQKFIGAKETHFFDWLITDMKSVNSIFNTKDINDLINISKIKKDEKNPFGFTNDTYRYHFTSFSHCESLHDVPSNSGKRQEIALVERYVRRYHRLIKLIKNDNIKIYFVRNGNISETEKNEFIKNILNHNNKCNFRLVECTYSNKPNSKYYININLNNYKVDDSNNSQDWKLTNFKWKNIFHDIKKIK